MTPQWSVRVLSAKHSGNGCADGLADGVFSEAASRRETNCRPRQCVARRTWGATKKHLPPEPLVSKHVPDSGPKNRTTLVVCLRHLDRFPPPVLDRFSSLGRGSGKN
jgi:hypothetical protein